MPRLKKRGSKRKRSRRSKATRRQRGGKWSSDNPPVWIPARPEKNPYLLTTSPVSLPPEYADLKSVEPPTPL